MSEGGERMCPLCAEEMDLTDQHLKPCKCGYEICVWCWHQIIDMAEKDETEGRCPACRTPYNKEKIVGMTSNCEKLVSEMSVEKKLKSHKGKSKTSEGRKQLGSVRVIQRNLVYVVGLQLNFADEDLLQRKEYFGQYGKVLKVSISRTATGAIQHFANSTCSVYITYSKEEEAIRCIQSVNGFTLDGRPLKACFGTTKYCHAWLRNMPCSNPDCLYLHEIGSQEDSFTKDEVISAYTRSRVQQITGATNSSRSGNVLPPPADENCNNSPALSGKLINKTAANTNHNSASGAVVSPPHSSSGRSAALPAGALWGTRSFNNQPISTFTPCSNGPLKPDACNSLVASSAKVASLIQVSSLQTNTGKNLVPIEENSISPDKIKLENLVPAKKESKPDSIAVLKSSSTSAHPPTSPLNQQLHGADTTKSAHNLSKMVGSSLKSFGPSLNNNYMDATDEIIENTCSDFMSLGIHNYAKQIKEAATSEAPARSENMTNALCVTDSLSDFGLGIPSQPTQVNICETEDDLLSFDNQRLKDPELTASINHLPDIFSSFHVTKLSTIPSVLNIADGPTSIDFCGPVVDKKDNLIVSASNFPLKSGGHPYNRLNSLDSNDVEFSNLFPSEDKRSLLGRYEGEVAIGAGNMGENSIISNILSMDFDSLDESLTSPQNLAKLWGETDKPQGSFGVSGSWKVQNSNQSRFSFAREDTNQVTNFGRSSNFLEKEFKQRPFGNDVPYSNIMHLDNDKIAPRNNFPFLGRSESDVFTDSHSNISNNKLSVSRSQISAPPGFSASSRIPPPGFSSYERADQISGTLSGNHIHDASSFSRNQWQTPPSSNTFINCDIEFMDPAILEVRHGTFPGGINSPVLDVKSCYSPQLNTFEEARLQSFLQRSLPPHTNQRINELGDGFSSISDVYGVRSRVMEQTLSNNFSPFSQFTHPQPRNAITSNGQWNGWNEGPGANNLGMAELLRSERLGFNKLYGGYEDSKIHMPGSGNMYNGSYGI
ncbi:uncharacterized protein [Primulina eburnea]|uniref:uncharacterized protein isoform X2 n=1 Tax=Primulina eburnea TaxID=1245227 RepID=UPI003C6CBD97